MTATPRPRAMIDTQQMTPCEKLLDSGIEDPKPIIALCGETIRFLSSFYSFAAIFKVYFDRGTVFASVFVAEIEVRDVGPQSVWVIIGDGPPAILMSHVKNGAEALYTYCYCLTKWVSKARLKEDLRKEMPVLAKDTYKPLRPSGHVFAMIEERVRFIEDEMLVHWRDEIPQLQGS